MWLNKSSELLKNEIENLLFTLRKDKNLSNLVNEALRKARRALSFNVGDERPWPLLSLIVCDAVCGRYEKGIPAATAFQFFLAAGDIFDDIEDADSPDSIYSKYGLAAAINTATTLLILGEQSLTRLKSKGVDDNVVVRAIDVANSFYTTACIGQHLDLATDKQISKTEETYYNIIAMKSAAQIECACYVGALVAGADQELINGFADFGSNLGMASQISNDIKDTISGKDIIRRKVTLPVIYAINFPDNDIQKKFRSLFQIRNGIHNNLESIKKLLFSIGAIHYATVKMNVYKQKAYNILSGMQASGLNVDRLKLLLK